MRRMGTPKHSLPECTAKLHRKTGSRKLLCINAQNKFVRCNVLAISALRAIPKGVVADSDFHAMKP